MRGTQRPLSHPALISSYTFICDCMKKSEFLMEHNGICSIVDTLFGTCPKYTHGFWKIYRISCGKKVHKIMSQSLDFFWARILEVLQKNAKWGPNWYGRAIYFGSWKDLPKWNIGDTVTGTVGWKKLAESLYNWPMPFKFLVGTKICYYFLQLLNINFGRTLWHFYEMAGAMRHSNTLRKNIIIH